MEEIGLRIMSMNPEEFLEQIRREKGTTLIVIACSGAKRRDDECAALINSLEMEIQERALVELYPSISGVVEDYRVCTQIHHPLAVEGKSKFYPSFVRYSGRFYKSITEADINTWQVIERKNWNILILSSYYGFLLPQENIQKYNLKISELNKDCKRKLPKILTSFLDVNRKVAKVLFFTSQQYAQPFVGKLKTNALKVSLLDRMDGEIIGPYGTDFYSLIGRLFYGIVSGKAIRKMDNVKGIVLEKL